MRKIDLHTVDYVSDANTDEDSPVFGESINYTYTLRACARRIEDMSYDLNKVEDALEGLLTALGSDSIDEEGRRRIETAIDVARESVFDLAEGFTEPMAHIEDALQAFDGLDVR